MDYTFIPLLQIRKLGHRKVKYFSQGRRASKWQSKYLQPRTLILGTLELVIIYTVSLGYGVQDHLLQIFEGLPNMK